MILNCILKGLFSFTSTYKSQPSVRIKAYSFSYINLECVFDFFFFIQILDGEISYFLLYVNDKNKSFCILNLISVYNPFLTLLYECIM